MPAALFIITALGYVFAFLPFITRSSPVRALLTPRTEHITCYSKPQSIPLHFFDCTSAVAQINQFGAPSSNARLQTFGPTAEANVRLPNALPGMRWISGMILHTPAQDASE
ncbi:hypothetical protein MMC21_007274 [Puttea exsequens]|nr:hypothetical protein [Puttea exsequens]